MLRDVRFRDALNYAIDSNKLCAVAYDGLAAPATTIMPPEHLVEPRLPLAAAGRPDVHVRSRQGQRPPTTRPATRAAPNGLRLYKGKPITLRLWTTTDFPEGQIEAKLIAG